MIKRACCRHMRCRKSSASYLKSAASLVRFADCSTRMSSCSPRSMILAKLLTIVGFVKGHWRRRFKTFALYVPILSIIMPLTSSTRSLAWLSLSLAGLLNRCFRQYTHKKKMCPGVDDVWAYLSKSHKIPAQNKVCAFSAH